MLQKIAGVFKGIAPDITPAQVKGAILFLVPATAKFLSALGLYTLSPADQKSLTVTLTGATAIAVIVYLADAIIRFGRNIANPGLINPPARALPKAPAPAAGDAPASVAVPGGAPAPIGGSAL